MSKSVSHLIESDLIPVGKILSPWGIRGGAKFLLYNSKSKALEKFYQVYIKSGFFFEVLTIVSIQKQGKFLVLYFEGYSSPEKVLELKGKETFLPTEKLPRKEKGEVYIFELVGMTVYSSQGEKLGKVKRVDNYGASEILVIESEKSEILIPVTSDTLKEVVSLEKKIVMNIPEGLF